MDDDKVVLEKFIKEQKAAVENSRHETRFFYFMLLVMVIFGVAYVVWSFG